MLKGITNCWQEETLVDHRKNGMIKKVQLEHFEQNQCLKLNKANLLDRTRKRQIPATAWNKGVCGRSLAGIAVSSPAGDMAVFGECFVWSGRGLCVGLIAHPEES